MNSRRIMGAVALSFAALAISGCSGVSETEKIENIATALHKADPTDTRLVAYANYDYRSGKSTRYERHATLVQNEAGCSAHGQFHAIASKQYGGGNEVKLTCLTLDGKVATKLECNVNEVGKPFCAAPSSNSARTPTFPSLD